MSYESFFLQFRLGMIYLSSKVRKYKKGKGKQPMIKIDDWVIEKGEKAQGKIKIIRIRDMQCRQP